MRGSVVSLPGTTVLALILLVAAHSSTIQAAPYPPPVGSLSVTASSTTPPAADTGGDGLDTWQWALMAAGLTAVLFGGLVLRRRKA